MINIHVNSEWTWVFASALPMAYGSYLHNNLNEVCTLKSAEPFFYFLRPGQFKPLTEIGDIGFNRDSYNHDYNPVEIYGPMWRPPPIKEHYLSKHKIKTAKEILVINNKYIEEWGWPCINYLNEEVLEQIFLKYQDKYEIYYIRYDGNFNSNDYFDLQDVTREGKVFDKGAIGKELHDYALLKKYPKVHSIYDFMKDHNYGFNEAQCVILANSNKHISVSGGTAVLSSLFKGDNIIYTSDIELNRNLERGVWKTDSWLKRLSGSKIYGITNYTDLMQLIESQW